MRPTSIADIDFPLLTPSKEAKFRKYEMTKTFMQAREDFKTAPVKYIFPRYIIRYFLLLPDPSPLPDQYTYVRTRPITPWQLKEIREPVNVIQTSPEDWLGRFETPVDNSVTRSHAARQGISASAELNLSTQDSEHGSKLHQFLSLVRIWNGTSHDNRTLSETRSVLEAVGRAHRIVPDPTEQDNVISATTQLVRRDYTVAEVLVPASEYPREERIEGVRDLLDYAIFSVQHMQRALYVVRKAPFKLVTKENLPNDLLYEITSISLEYAKKFELAVGNWQTFQTEINIADVYAIRPPTLSSAELESYDHSMLNFLQVAPLQEFHELRRRAVVALERHGHYNESVIWSATACEYLLDETLRLLMWEREKLPEDATSPFLRSSITQRVKSSFTQLAGTSWNLKSGGPIFDWFNNIAKVRNSIVHDNYNATSMDSATALQSADALVTHIGDLMVTKFDLFWRCAYLLLGIDGLARRAKLDDYEIRAKGVWEPEWQQSFQEWRSCHRLLLHDAFERRESSVTDGDLIFVWGRLHRGFWLVSDNVTNQAIRVEVDEESLTEHQLRGVYEVLDGPQNPNDERAVSMAFEGARIKRSHTPWVERHNLMPMFGALISGRDIKDAEFTWRPRRQLAG